MLATAIHSSSRPIALALVLFAAACLSACLSGEDPPKQAGTDADGNAGDDGQGSTDGSDGGSGNGSDGGAEDGDGGGDGNIGEDGGGSASPAWENLAALNVARAGHTSCAAGGRVFVFGGHDGTAHLDSVEVYDPGLDTWSLLDPMTLPRYGAACATVENRIYLFGGETYDGATYSLVSDVSEFDADTMTWTDCGGACAPMVVPRYLLGAAALNGKIYVTGGLDSDGNPTARLDEYDPDTDDWTDCGGACAMIPEARHNAALVAFEGLLILAGGGSPDQAKPEVWSFDAVANVWEPLEPMPQGRCCMAASAGSGGNLYIFGGQTGAPALDNVLEYNPELSVWTEAPSMDAPRTSSAAAELSGLIYIAGGHDGSAAYFRATARFNPEGD